MPQLRYRVLVSVHTSLVLGCLFPRIIKVLEVTFISKWINSQVNHQDLERLSHKGIHFDSCEEVLLCWTVLVRTARRAEEECCRELNSHY